MVREKRFKYRPQVRQRWARRKAAPTNGEKEGQSNQKTNTNISGTGAGVTDVIKQHHTLQWRKIFSECFYRQSWNENTFPKLLVYFFVPKIYISSNSLTKP